MGRLERFSAWLAKQTPPGIDFGPFLIDRVFRLAIVGVLAPTILFPVFVTSSVEYRFSAILIFPSIAFTFMIGAALIHTAIDPPEVLSRTVYRHEPRVVQSCLFLALTILVKPLVFPPTV